MIEEYIEWLRGLVGRPSPLYGAFFEMAWEIPYEYHIPNDDNRAEDGLRLRDTFESESSLRLPDLGECRILEFLVALAIRMNEATYQYDNPDRVPYWFWRLVDNLEMTDFDDFYPFHRVYEDIAERFERLNSRDYAPDGSNGGLFPLKEPTEDQRDVEVWYQMMAYLQETL